MAIIVAIVPFQAFSRICANAKWFGFFFAERTETSEQMFSETNFISVYFFCFSDHFNLKALARTKIHTKKKRNSFFYSRRKEKRYTELFRRLWNAKRCFNGHKMVDFIFLIKNSVRLLFGFGWKVSPPNE